MATIRLYRALKEKNDAQAVYDAARFNGNYGPPNVLSHGSPLVLRLRDAVVELTNAMFEAKEIIENPDPTSRAAAMRFAGEKDVARHLVNSLIQQGFTLRGNDGEEETRWYDDPEPLLAVMFDTDDYILDVTRTQDGETIDGWIHLIYGNSPYEMMSDYTTNITQYTIPTQEYIKAYYDPTYIVDKGE